jgi:hypothetical protein
LLEATLAAQARVLQIIVFAMVSGVVIFGGFLIVTGSLQKPPEGTLLSYAAVGFSFVALVLHVVIPAAIERAAIANQPVGSGPEALLGVYFTRTIIAAALLEGAAFLTLVAVMIEHQPWILGATAVLIVLMLLQFPSRTRMEHWLESRLMERG